MHILLGTAIFKDKSVINYTIFIAECFAWLSKFEVIELDPTFSDGHPLLSWSLEIQNTSIPNNSYTKTMHMNVI